MADADYVELLFDVPAGDADDYAYELAEAGIGGVEVRDDSTLEKSVAGRATLVAWVLPSDLERFLALAGPLKKMLRPNSVTRSEGEWRDVWKKHFKTQRIGRFVIVPSWEIFTPNADDVVLALDPGRAFGTGTHPSTRLCLAISSEIPAVRRVLDVGCGSGVLAIATCKRFPECTGVGLDIDPDAVEVSRENAERNRTLVRLAFCTLDVRKQEGEFDLVFANIQPDVLVPMMPALCARLQRGGTLVLSGIIDEAAAGVKAAFSAHPALEFLEQKNEAGWTAFAFRARDMGAR